MYLEPVLARRTGPFRAAVIGSIVAHAALAVVAIHSIARANPRKYGIVEFIVQKAEARAPEPVKPEPPKPKTPPPPAEKAPEPSIEPPKPVFGVSEDATTTGDSGMSVRVGNTLMKEPEKEFTDPGQVKPYSGEPRSYEARELDVPPKPLRIVEPRYPPLAKATGKIARVVLRILINKKGRVVQAQVVTRAEEDLGFEAAAVAAVMQWRFSPPTVGGVAVDAWADLPVRFALD